MIVNTQQNETASLSSVHAICSTSLRVHCCRTLNSSCGTKRVYPNIKTQGTFPFRSHLKHSMWVNDSEQAIRNTQYNFYQPLAWSFHFQKLLSRVWMFTMYIQIKRTWPILHPHITRKPWKLAAGLPPLPFLTFGTGENDLMIMRPHIKTQILPNPTWVTTAMKCLDEHASNSF